MIGLWVDVYKTHSLVPKVLGAPCSCDDAGIGGHFYAFGGLVRYHRFCIIVQGQTKDIREIRAIKFDGGISDMQD